MKTICTRALDAPVQTGFECFLLQDPFCQGTTANIPKANHQNFHGANIAMSHELLTVSCIGSSPTISKPTANSSQLMWNLPIRASKSKSIAMINKEISQVDLLDILFENRNKAYGAYALRKNYNKRLQWALAISLSCVLLFALTTFGNANQHDRAVERTTEVSISTVDIKKTQVPGPTQPRQVSPATQRPDTRPQIVPDDHVPKPEVRTSSELSREIISAINVNGSSPDSGNGPSTSTNGSGNTGTLKAGASKPEIQLMSSDAQFPGGKGAFAKFLTRYLITPGDLEAGEKKLVLVRFMVDIDGSISKMEIIQSDGEEYSREVMRVLAKMPKWIPAMQNGAKVATWFSQPVSFIGIEQ